MHFVKSEELRDPLTRAATVHGAVAFTGADAIASAAMARAESSEAVGSDGQAKARLAGALAAFEEGLQVEYGSLEGIKKGKGKATDRGKGTGSQQQEEEEEEAGPHRGAQGKGTRSKTQVDVEGQRATAACERSLRQVGGYLDTCNGRLVSLLGHGKWEWSELQGELRG
jgi:hypothetical protein